MNKKYKHPTLGREATSVANMDGFFDVKSTDDEVMRNLTKKELLALGFQPVEEAKTDWIDEAFEECYPVPPFLIQQGKNRFRRIIEKHMPQSNLVPLDVEALINKIWTKYPGDLILRDYMKHELSKYGVPQCIVNVDVSKEAIFEEFKKEVESGKIQIGGFTVESIRDWVKENYNEDFFKSTRFNTVLRFITDNNLLLQK